MHHRVVFFDNILSKSDTIRASRDLLRLTYGFVSSNYTNDANSKPFKFDGTNTYTKFTNNKWTGDHYYKYLTPSSSIPERCCC